MKNEEEKNIFGYMKHPHLSAETQGTLKQD